MPSIPLLKTGTLALDVWQSRMKAELDPLLANKLVQGTLIQNQTLKPGVNQVNHLLGRNQLGWSLVDIAGPAVVWRSQPFNSTQLTLTCSAVAAVTASFWFF